MVGNLRVTGHKYEIAWLTTILPYSFRTHCMYLFSAFSQSVATALIFLTSVELDIIHINS